MTKKPFALANLPNTLICNVDEMQVQISEEHNLHKNDCFLSKTPQDLELQPSGNIAKLLIFKWEKNESECLKRKNARLYDVLKLKKKEYFHMIHAGDKYLSGQSSLKIDAFLDILKTDFVLVDHQLPGLYSIFL